MTPRPPPSTLFPYTTLFRTPGAATRRDDGTSHAPTMNGAQYRAPTVASMKYPAGDRKSTRLNSSHRTISYAVFCLKKKKKSQVTCDAISDGHAASSHRRLEH